MMRSPGAREILVGTYRAALREVMDRATPQLAEAAGMPLDEMRAQLRDFEELEVAAFRQELIDEAGDADA